MKLFIILCLCVAMGYAKRTFNGDQVLSVYPKHRYHLEILKNIEDDFTNVNFLRPLNAEQAKVDSEVQIHFNANVVKEMKRLLSSKGIGYEVKVADLQAVFDEEMRSIKAGRSIADFNYDIYHTWAEIDAWVDDITTDYPALVSSEVIGYSTESKPLHMLTVTADTTPDRWVLIDCGFHAREWISPAFCLRFTQDLVDYYNSGDSQIIALMSNMAFKILPVFNPDGYDYSWTDDRMWRKTRSAPTGLTNCYGTDPNRNFDAGWGGEGASSNTCAQTYMGTEVESAPETTAYSDYIRANINNIEAYLTVHSYGQFIIIPYSYTSDTDLLYPTNFDELAAVAADMQSAITGVFGTSYDYGNGALEFYPASGGSDDFAKLEGVRLSYTIELRPCSNCAAGFQLPPAQIQNTCTETFEGVIAMAQNAYDNP